MSVKQLYHRLYEIDPELPHLVLSLLDSCANAEYKCRASEQGIDEFFNNIIPHYENQTRQALEGSLNALMQAPPIQAIQNEYAG